MRRRAFKPDQCAIECSCKRVRMSCSGRRLIHAASRCKVAGRGGGPAFPEDTVWRDGCATAGCMLMRYVATVALMAPNSSRTPSVDTALVSWLSGEQFTIIILALSLIRLDYIAKPEVLVSYWSSGRVIFVTICGIY